MFREQCNKGTAQRTY